MGGGDTPLHPVVVIALYSVLFEISLMFQGIMGILSGSLGQEFFEFCYNPVGEVSVQLSFNIPKQFLFLQLMDMMTLVNCMINFILYCTMSRQFRLTFR